MPPAPWMMRTASPSPTNSSCLPPSAAMTACATATGYYLLISAPTAFASCCRPCWTRRSMRSPVRPAALPQPSASPAIATRWHRSWASSFRRNRCPTCWAAPCRPPGYGSFVWRRRRNIRTSPISSTAGGRSRTRARTGPWSHHPASRPMTCSPRCRRPSWQTAPSPPYAPAHTIFWY